MVRDHADLRTELEREVRDHGGIGRKFMFGHADGYPAELFLLAMACGFGLTTVHWPSQRRMLAAEFPRSKLAEIIRRTREGGAGEGWSACRVDQHIHDLGPAFGTKLLYFAGCRALAAAPAACA